MENDLKFSKEGNMAKAGKRKTEGTKKGASWKLERASGNRRQKSGPRSNKYSGQDTSRKPPPNSRQRVWVGGYTRADGTHVKGYYRQLSTE
jgi:hypothetical protein